jgi:hypothetical protein
MNDTHERKGRTMNLVLAIARNPLVAKAAQDAAKAVGVAVAAVVVKELCRWMDAQQAKRPIVSIRKAK